MLLMGICVMVGAVVLVPGCVASSDLPVPHSLSIDESRNIIRWQLDPPQYSDRRHRIERRVYDVYGEIVIASFQYAGGQNPGDGTFSFDLERFAFIEGLHVFRVQRVATGAFMSPDMYGGWSEAVSFTPTLPHFELEKPIPTLTDGVMNFGIIPYARGFEIERTAIFPNGSRQVHVFSQSGFFFHNVGGSTSGAINYEYRVRAVRYVWGDTVRVTSDWSNIVVVDQS